MHGVALRYPAIRTYAATSGRACKTLKTSSDGTIMNPWFFGNCSHEPCLPLYLVPTSGIQDSKRLRHGTALDAMSTNITGISKACMYST